MADSQPFQVESNVLKLKEDRKPNQGQTNMLIEDDWPSFIAQQDFAVEKSNPSKEDQNTRQY